jgi:hypothetical protein
MPASRTEQSEWREEVLRYRVLRAVYERAGAKCHAVVTGSQIGAALGLGFDDLFRLTYWLDVNEYITCIDLDSRICITEKGIHYMEALAGRRRTIRE